MISQILVTVCITTFNRPEVTCKLLKRLFHCKEVEYIVVDDGSTQENLDRIRACIDQNRLPVHLHNKENGGKLSALRFGLQYAKGKYFTDLDSDDYMLESNIHNIISGIRQVEALRAMGGDVIGVCGLSATPEGKVVGDSFPAQLKVATYFDMRLDFNLRGNKVEVILTEKLRHLKIPFFAGEKRMPTNVQWFSLLASQILFVDKPFEIYVPNRSDSISINIRRHAIQAKNSTRTEHKIIIQNKKIYKSKSHYLMAFINYVRFSFHRASPFFEKGFSFNQRLLLICVLPIGFLVYCRDLLIIQFKKAKSA